ncbi:hypothetical protein RHMOL_Rhmol08G0238100 [Rhododendron molle]|uniref:Uncharacterized protein n=1 Tax=Rhododendron molle TaxID=49168 RepID=A0ACC0MT49_RHOML|nr:hypothetical protein RHMOL_Rhmol08G0238100 [Rhododendron molle]
MLKLSEIRHSESWPFLITLLTKCVTLEISSSKRRLSKLIFHLIKLNESFRFLNEGYAS